MVVPTATELAACPSALRFRCELSTENGGSCDSWWGRLWLILRQGSPHDILITY
jgi:hypothetical protein